MEKLSKSQKFKTKFKQVHICGSQITVCAILMELKILVTFFVIFDLLRTRLISDLNLIKIY